MLRRLGAGGMGTVYLAVDPSGNQVAVKIVRSDLARIAEFRDRFKREAENARRVARFCTAAVLDVDVSAYTPYLVTEYVDGPTLSEAVHSRGPLTPAELHQLAVSMTTALMAIHRAGIVHRDLKPSNILLSRLGPKVIDFGIARALDTASLLSHDRRVGTPAFMAPEQALGDVITSAADVFAWGGVLVYAGTGHYPFGTGPAAPLLFRAVNDPPDLNGVEESLRPLVEDAMRKAPADRPTAERLYARLLDLRVDGPAAGTDLPLSEVTALIRPLGAAPPPTPTGRTGDAAGPITPVTGGQPDIPPPPVGSRNPRPRPPSSPGSSGSARSPGSKPARSRPTDSPRPPLPGGPADQRRLDPRRPDPRRPDQRSPASPYSSRPAGPSASPGPPVRYPVRPARTPAASDTDFAGALTPVRSGGGGYETSPPVPWSAGQRPPEQQLPEQRPRAGGRSRVLVAGVLAATVAAAAAVVVSMARPPSSPQVSIPDQVAAKAVRLNGSDPELARRLALAAYQTDPQSTATRNAMLALFGTDIAPTTVTAADGAVLSAAYNPDGTLVATGDETERITLWDVSDMANPTATDTVDGAAGWVNSVAFNPAGSVLAAGHSDGTVSLWDVTDSEEVTRLSSKDFHSDDVHSVSFSPDGNTLASGSSDGQIALWDVTDPEDPEPRATGDGHTGGIRSVAFAPQGALLAFGGNDGTVRLWDVVDAANPTELQSLPVHEQASRAVAFNRDATMLASGGIDSTVRLWDVSSPDDPVEKPTVQMHFGGITAVAVSPDSTIVASAGEDETVRLTDVSDPARPAVLATLEEHTGVVNAVSFAPDGNAVATAGHDGSLRLWELNPAELAENACTDPANEISATEWSENFGELGYQPSCQPGGG